MGTVLDEPQPPSRRQACGAVRIHTERSGRADVYVALYEIPPFGPTSATNNHEKSVQASPETGAGPVLKLVFLWSGGQTFG